MAIVFLEPSQRSSVWRNLWPAAELRRRGHDVTVYAADATNRGQVLMGRDDVIVHITALTWGGKIGSTPLSICAEVRKYARRMFLSMDDDWTKLHDVQPNDLGVRLFAAEIPVVCKMASGVIVSTPHLAGVYGKWAKTHVVPNCLPASWVGKWQRPKRNGRLGYMGFFDIHGKDWALLEPWVKDMPPLQIIGGETRNASAFATLRGWGAKDVRSSEQTYDLRKLYRECSEPRAAVIPLLDHGFNRAKSWIKPMEFAAQGVPSVASDHPEYRALAERIGWPTIARDPADLYATAVELWENPITVDPSVILDAGLVMESEAGDGWEKALTG